MRWMILLVILTGLLDNVKAQTWEEWTQQDQLRIRRLEEQLAAYKIFLDKTRKGIAIAGNGLQLIRDIKSGDFSLHGHYFDSLHFLSPSLRQWLPLPEIIRAQTRLVKTAEGLNRKAVASGQFTGEELAYCKKVCNRVLEASLQQLEELFNLISEGGYTLQDEERFSRLNTIYQALQEQQDFLASFQQDLLMLALQRLTDRTEINYSKQLK